jgi:UDP-N-acetylglucosamine--dolichyl-phosphate N-acetylglucosaminephosphotransferase
MLMSVELVVLAVGFAVSRLTMPLVMDFMRKRGIIGIDMHKKNRPEIPEMGGVAVLLGLASSVLTAIVLMPEQAVPLVGLLSSSLIAGVVGAADDLRPLNAKVKPLLTLFSGVPILLLGIYNPRGPILPIVGQTRLTIVYPLMIIVAMAVTSNAVNMMDPFNGTMSGTCTVITGSLIASSLLLGREDGLLLSLCLFGPLLVLYLFNRYPARVFSGDVGSLSIGAALGAIAIIGQLEVVAVVAFAPQIMNAFYGLSTIGGLYERREVPRPVALLENGKLMATSDPKAPITLARVILAHGPLHEREAARIFIILSIISGVMAILTAYLIKVTA